MLFFTSPAIVLFSYSLNCSGDESNDQFVAVPNPSGFCHLLVLNVGDPEERKFHT